MKEKATLVVGILIGIAIVGCIAAVTVPDKAPEEGRYQFITASTIVYDGYEIVILDTQTGMVNVHDACTANGIEASTVYPFVSE